MGEVVELVCWVPIRLATCGTVHILGDGIEVLSLMFSPLLEAVVSVSTDAAAGWHDVRVDSGDTSTVLYDGFQVDRVGLVASFEPGEATQGDTVDLRFVQEAQIFVVDSEITFSIALVTIQISCGRDHGVDAQNFMEE